MEKEREDEKGQKEEENKEEEQKGWGEGSEVMEVEGG